MNKYLGKTKIVDYDHKEIQKVIDKKAWKKLSQKKQIEAIYTFVRDEIKFGYNEGDEISASKVLKDGYGQCNTKSNLLMAFFRALGIECRIHGFTVEKSLKRGAIQKFWFPLVPRDIVHAWVEVKYNQKWYALEGVIIDKEYLNKVQKEYKGTKEFCSFGISTDDLNKPQIEWNESDTFIQQKSINNDYGLFDNPDEFYSQYRQNMNFIKNFFFKYIIRKSINRNINKIRKYGF